MRRGQHSEVQGAHNFQACCRAGQALVEVEGRIGLLLLMVLLLWRLPPEAFGRIEDKQDRCRQLQLRQGRYPSLRPLGEGSSLGV